MLMEGVHMLMGVVWSQPDIKIDSIESVYTHMVLTTKKRRHRPKPTSINRLQAATPCEVSDNL